VAEQRSGCADKKVEQWQEFYRYRSPFLCDCTDCIRPIMHVRLLLHVLNKRLKIKDMMNGDYFGDYFLFNC